MFGSLRTARGRSFLELLTVSTLAIAGPLFIVLADGPEFFVNVRADRFDIFALILILVLVLPVLMWTIEGAMGLFSVSFARFVHESALVICLALFFTQLLTREIELPGLMAIVSAMVGAVMIVFARRRWPEIQRLFVVLSPVVLISVLSFCSRTEIRALLWPKTQPSIQHRSGQNLPPVVVMIFDEFPLNVLLNDQLEIDAQRFPNFAAFRSQAHWFRNATSVNQFTPVAVPAILAGVLPNSRKKLPTSESYPENMFTVLAQSHALNVYEPFTNLCPPALCKRASNGEGEVTRLVGILLDVAAIYFNVALPADLGLSPPDIDGKWGDFWGADAWMPPRNPHERRLARFVEHIDSLEASAEPTFYFNHVLLPHTPYQFMPSGKVYRSLAPSGYQRGKWAENEPLAQFSYQQFLHQVGAMDRVLGRLIDKLKTIGVYDRALMIVTSDHGVSFQPGTHRRGHYKHPSFYEDILNVPLFIKLPHQTEGHLNERNVEAIDVFPTIAEQLGIELKGAQGRSAFGDSSARPEKQITIGKVLRAKGAIKEAEIDGSEVTKVVTVSLPERFPRRTLDWKLNLPGYRTPNSINPYFVGPHSELLGQRAEIFRAKELADGTYEFFLDTPALDTRSQFILGENDQYYPHVLAGKLNGSFSTDAEVAIAVNGLLHSFAKVNHTRAKQIQFAALVSDGAFRVGENTIELFSVESSGSKENSGIELKLLVANRTR